ncbi:hypothetical protein ONS95_010320 [Cadophora gregata]|uniref:uncharacterized protein n=1 Tax=Cadophora gregata TaxID=51156 RepID=UPI0026DBE8E0|nr:uncharacterized protein ONS95_010320 [Cadophora gregata]KAK0122056.1 hypothetical protein ONS95_010320 [Cadophora gregata]
MPINRLNYNQCIMVYCGKPSKACGECRLRRTKCDTRRPACSQCIRAGRTCNGYRDPSDMIFRDESGDLKSRRHRLKISQFPKKERLGNMTPTAADSTGALIITGSDRSPQPSSTTNCQTLPVMCLGLGTSPGEQATCFFFQNYVFQQDFSFRGNFQYLLEIYEQEDVKDGLADSVSALGLVGLAHFWGAPSILAFASAKYNSALLTISSQLRTIEGARSDQTMAAIMLLGLYETNTCNNRQSMDTWTRHITGALALLQVRGKELLSTPVGYNLFVYLRTQLITNCLLRHAKVPAIISEWSQDLDFETAEQAAATTLSNLTIRYCNLRASMHSFRDYSDPDRIVSTACALDAEYEMWARTCPVQLLSRLPINLDRGNMEQLQKCTDPREWVDA